MAYNICSAEDFDNKFGRLLQCLTFEIHERWKKPKCKDATNCRKKSFQNSSKWQGHPPQLREAILKKKSDFMKNFHKRDFTNTGRGGVTILWKFFIKSEFFLKDGLKWTFWKNPSQKNYHFFLGRPGWDKIPSFSKKFIWGLPLEEPPFKKNCL